MPRFILRSASPKRCLWAVSAGTFVLFAIFFTSASGVVNWFISSRMRFAVFEMVVEESCVFANEGVDDAVDKLDDGRISVGVGLMRRAF